MNVIGCSIRVCNNVDNMWMLLDEGSIRVCNVDNMWMLLDEGSISNVVWMLLDKVMCNVDICECYWMKVP